MNTKFEFPIQINIEQEGQKIEPQIRKAFRFFRFISEQSDGQLKAKPTRFTVELLVKDVKLQTDIPGVIYLKAPGLYIEIHQGTSREISAVWVEVNGREYEIIFYGFIDISVKDNKALIELYINSIPKVFVY